MTTTATQQAAKTLSGIIALYQEVEERLIENGGELTPEIEEMLAEQDAAIETKFDAYAGALSHMKAQEDWLKAEAKRLADRAKTLANGREAMRGRMVIAMQTLSIDKLKTIAHSYSLRQTESWEVNDDNFSVRDLDKLIALGAGERTYKVNMTRLKELCASGELGAERPDYVTVSNNTSINIR